MSTLDQNNAAYRREMRRRKILEGSEDRMKRITGQTDSDQAESTHSDATEATVPNFVRANDASTAPDITPNNPSPVLPTVTSSQDQVSPQPELDSQVTKSQASSTPQTREQLLDQSFYRFRHALCFVVGILVRISFLYSFGEEYVQTILNPFAALEIALVGYQKSSGMDLGMNVKGGLWLSALILSGFNPDIIQSYKSVMGVLSAVADDFTIFFFAFVVRIPEEYD